MKTVFARAFVTAAVLALPASAFASTQPAHHHMVAKKETTKKKGKHRGHKTASKAHATPAATKSP